jgi:hypothetical protein
MFGTTIWLLSSPELARSLSKHSRQRNSSGISVYARRTNCGCAGGLPEQDLRLGILLRSPLPYTPEFPVYLHNQTGESTPDTTCSLYCAGKFELCDGKCCSGSWCLSPIHATASSVPSTSRCEKALPLCFEMKTYPEIDPHMLQVNWEHFKLSIVH